GGPGTVSSYQKSYQEYVDQNLKYGEQVENTEIIVPEEGKAFLNGQQQTSDNNSNSQSQNNEQGQQQATDNNVATQNNQQQTQSQEPAQAEAKALPETGEQSTNTGLVASIATLLLAVGSALTFKRFSKNNK
ncbi:TPA: LPXTG cell wall anchor domain-containing protein, partial [Streptococcus pyogenes]|nr:LPXTG cell wall anchor domain-containing protein [Streptococcus pyogenes]